MKSKKLHHLYQNKNQKKRMSSRPRLISIKRVRLSKVSRLALLANSLDLEWKRVMKRNKNKFHLRINKIKSRLRLKHFRLYLNFQKMKWISKKVKMSYKSALSQLVLETQKILITKRMNWANLLSRI